MNAMRSMKWGFAAVAVAAVMAGLPGCELIVQFDRSLIPGGGGPDATVPDSGSDALASDAPASDAPGEAATGDDGGSAADALSEGSADAPVGIDAPADSPAAGDDGSTDAPTGVTGDDGSTDATDDGAGDDASGDDSG